MIDDQQITTRNGTACCMMDKITVQQAKRYVKAMRETADSVQAVLRMASRLLPELFEGLRPAEVIHAAVAEVLTVIKALHFVMQEVVLPKFSVLSTEPPVEQETSVFDEYDEENGYNELDEINVWDTCLENIEAVTQAAIKIMRQSYTDTMKEELVPLLEHLRWEIDHQPEQKGG